MSISRITTWVDGNTLTAAALNAEFDNILNNATALVSPLTANLNAGFNRITNLRLDAVTAYTVTTTANRARIAFNNNENILVISRTDTGPFDAIGPQTNQPTRVSGLIGTMISNVGSFQALGYTMRTTVGMMFGVSATSSYSVNTQTAGPTANGRDQAGAFASTTVHFYAISTGVGSTAPAGVVSSVAPPTGPTLPTNYTGWCYLGSGIYTVATSVMTRSLRQVGNTVHLTPVALVTGGTATTATDVSAGTVVPVIASQLILDAQFEAFSTVQGTVDVTVDINTGGGTQVGVLQVKADAQSSSLQISRWARDSQIRVINTETTPSFQYDLTVNTGGLGAAGIDVWCRGYILPNGDV